MKYVKKAQSGMTIFSVLVILIVVGFFVYMGMRLVPPYVDYFDVSAAMEQVATEGVSGKSLRQVRRDFDLKLSFQYADDIIKPKDVTFEKNKKGGTTMHVDYEQKVHFLYNIDFLLHFKKSVELQGTQNY